MLKKILSLLILSVICLSLSSTVLAVEKEASGPCDPGDTCKYGCYPGNTCINDTDKKPFSCQPDVNPDGTPKFDAIIKTKRLYACLPVTAVEKVFGTIQPPAPLANLLKNDPTGAGGISQFLSNLVALFFSIAAIVLIFMLLWGAFDWMTSEGDKEKLQSAQRKIISAIIGIVLFAITFAVIAVLGQFTGFKFFKGQGVTRGIVPGTFHCPNGDTVWGNPSDDPDLVCKGHGT